MKNIYMQIYTFHFQQHDGSYCNNWVVWENYLLKKEETNVFKASMTGIETFPKIKHESMKIVSKINNDI